MSRRCVRPLVLLALCGACGCGETFGGLFYYLNLLPKRKVTAEFTLTTDPLLVLVDDDMELVTWLPARDRLVDDLALRLREAGANARVIPSQTVNALRQMDPTYEERSIQEIGRKAGATQVLWIQVRDFHARTEIQTILRAARFTARLKVFDPAAEHKSDMRLWPDDREGYLVTVEKSAGELQGLDSDEAVARMLVKEMADQIAKLFYEHTLDE